MAGSFVRPSHHMAGAWDVEIENLGKETAELPQASVFLYRLFMRSLQYEDFKVARLFFFMWWLRTLKQMSVKGEYEEVLPTFMS